MSWHPNGEFLVAGGVDSVVRVFEVSRGRCVTRITLDTNKNEETLVWATVILAYVKYLTSIKSN